MADDRDSQRRALALAKKLNSVREPSMRDRLLAEALAEPPATRAAHTLHALVHANRTRPTAATRSALETLGSALSTPELVPYAVRAELYSAATSCGFDEIARMFFDVSAPALDDADEDPSAERPLVPRGRPLSIGERKSLARGPVRGQLELLLRDPHPHVIEILLANPHVTERDVLTIATKRPARAETLAVVAASDKWARRYPIKRALAFNPHAPPHLTVRLVTTLPSSDLRAIAADPTLPDPLRAQARSLLDA